jgi:hypothetical protein
MVQGRAIVNIADIHAGTLANRFEAFQDLDVLCPVFFALCRYCCRCRSFVAVGGSGVVGLQLAKALRPGFFETGS